MTIEKDHRIAFRIHPRVFAALGADLVTNDIVAVIELVKNSYDAFATRVDVRFGSAELARALKRPVTILLPLRAPAVPLFLSACPLALAFSENGFWVLRN